MTLFHMRRIPIIQYDLGIPGKATLINIIKRANTLQNTLFNIHILPLQFTYLSALFKMSTKPTTTDQSLVGSKRGLATEEVSIIDTTHHHNDELIAMPASKILKTNGASGKQQGKAVGASQMIEMRDGAQKGGESESEDEENDKVKWKTLEHHGVIFFESYKPHGVKILHKGKPLELTPEQEEACNWWALVIGSDFAEIPRVKTNYEKTLLDMFDPKYGVKALADLDFTPIRDYLLAQREAKKARPLDERKKEIEERQRADAFYKYCLIDGELEKVSNCLVEPPGIFRGRGEHPHAGRFKYRIVPEMVTLNIGEDDPIPVCPIPGHSWKRIISNTDATWLCQFKDERHEKANVKYVFLSADSKIKGKNDRKKYEKARRLAANIDDIKLNYNQKIMSDDAIDNQLGICTYLIDKLALRVGNEKGEDEADTKGCCSLEVQNVQFPEKNFIKLDFLGKDSIRYENTVEVPEAVYNKIRQCAQGKKPDDLLFHLINTGKLNDYLKSMMSDLSAKVFRTYNASITLQKQLYHSKDHGEPAKVPELPLEQRIKYYNKCNLDVARLCNHQKAAAKNFDEQVGKMEARNKEMEDKITSLEKLMPKLKKGQLSDDAKLPKSVDACKAEIEKTQKKLEQEKIKLEEKMQTKNHALGTSKINYMDPRITISWCKNSEVPIEKLFTKNLREKFAWAMDNEPSWRF